MIIPVRRAGIFILVCRKPDTAPASIPAMKPPMVARRGFRPFIIKMAVVAAPSGKDPSAVRSAISKIRKVMKTPIAIIDQSKP